MGSSFAATDLGFSLASGQPILLQAKFYKMSHHLIFDRIKMHIIPDQLRAGEKKAHGPEQRFCYKFMGVVGGGAVERGENGPV